jgi:hypothetical protein
VRTEIGEVLSVNELDHLPNVIDGLLSEDLAKVSDIRRSREKRVFNLDKSASIGADFIEKILEEHK